MFAVCCLFLVVILWIAFCGFVLPTLCCFGFVLWFVLLYFLGLICCDYFVVVAFILVCCYTSGSGLLVFDDCLFGLRVEF